MAAQAETRFGSDLNGLIHTCRFETFRLELFLVCSPRNQYVEDCMHPPFSLYLVLEQLTLQERLIRCAEWPSSRLMQLWTAHHAADSNAATAVARR